MIEGLGSSSLEAGSIQGSQQYVLLVNIFEVTSVYCATSATALWNACCLATCAFCACEVILWGMTL